MFVPSQLPIQTTKMFYSFFDVYLCPHHFEKGSATHAYNQFLSAKQSFTTHRLGKIKSRITKNGTKRQIQKM